MLSLLTNLLLSIVAGIVTHYICKWLDSRDR